MCARGAVFGQIRAFNGDISTWDVSSVTRMDASASPLAPSLLHLVFACHRALRLRTGIMGESGARFRATWGGSGCAWA
eukprot:COSAG01_NODE_1489_length_10133_cov_189.288120_2_plen_78_part_00